MFSGRLFAPGLPGTGVEASGCWQDGELRLAAGGREFVVATPQLAASGFNRERWQVSWSDADGDYAFFVESAAARSAFALAAPPALAATLHGVRRRQAGVERRFRWGWAALGLILLAPFIALAVFFVKADAIAAWAVTHIPHEQEAKLGDLVLAQTRVQMRLSESGPAVEAVRTIGDKLTVGTRHKYRWFVAERPEINAFAAPGGVVVVFSGLLRNAKSAEEAAGVIAHEVAHAELRHGLQGMAKSLGLRALMALALGDVSGAMLADLATGLTEMRFSRDAEREADREGLRRLVAAGIDPRGMVVFFETLAKSEGKVTPPAILSTHPATGERIENLRREVAAAQGSWQALPIDWAAVQAALPARK